MTIKEIRYYYIVVRDGLLYDIYDTKCHYKNYKGTVFYNNNNIEILGLENVPNKNINELKDNLELHKDNWESKHDMPFYLSHRHIPIKQKYLYSANMMLKELGLVSTNEIYHFPKDVFGLNSNYTLRFIDGLDTDLQVVIQSTSDPNIYISKIAPLTELKQVILEILDILVSSNIKQESTIKSKIEKLLLKHF
jgi:hypothetical protein